MFYCMSMITDPSISAEQREKEIAQKEYTDAHVANVNKAWEIMKSKPKCITILNELGINFEMMDLQIANHDRSKYGIEEWEAYRKNFFPVNEQEKEDNKADFERAWLHHYTVNFHHWNGWARLWNQEMPMIYVVEMCCDWIAMSMKFGGDAYHWYKNEKDIVLGEKQEQVTDRLLKAYYDL